MDWVLIKLNIFVKLIKWYVNVCVYVYLKKKEMIILNICMIVIWVSYDYIFSNIE